ncbi:MAG: hypothetical protein ACOZBZ_02800 [Patescibacteria group bacterium]
MPRQIIADTFESLGQTAGQTVKQVVQEPGKLAEEAAKQVGVKPEPGVEQTGQGPTPTQIAQRKAQDQRRLSYLERELEAIKRRKAERLPAQVTGKPGFSEEKAIKQIEIEKEEKKKLPPVAELAKKKGGTGERKIMGISG